MAKNGKRKQQRNRRVNNRRNRTNVTVIPAAAVSRSRRQPRRRARKSGLLADIGGVAGSIFGNTGERIGRAIGGGVSRIFGSGAYSLSGTARKNTLAGTTPPSFGSLTAATRIRHREYISDIVGSTEFSVHSYPIAPGVASLFPWLSRIALNYEQYRICGLVIEFKSTSATALNSINTALGVVGLVTQYDASEDDFVSKQEAENYVGCQSCAPSQSMLHFVECAAGQNPLNKLYVRVADLQGDEDIKFYDMGKVQLFTQGMQAAATIGELWVSYDIEFSKPKLPAGGVGSVALVDYYIQPSIGTGNINWSGKINGVKKLPDVGNIGTYIIDKTLYFPKTVPVGQYVVLIVAHIESGAATGTKIFTALTNGGTLEAGDLCFSRSATEQDSYFNFSTTAANDQFVVCNWKVLPSTAVLTQGTLLLTGFDMQGTGAATFNMNTFVFAWPGLPDPTSKRAQKNLLSNQYASLLKQIGELERKLNLVITPPVLEEIEDMIE